MRIATVARCTDVITVIHAKSQVFIETLPVATGGDGDDDDDDESTEDDDDDDDHEEGGGIDDNQDGSGVEEAEGEEE